MDLLKTFKFQHKSQYFGHQNFPQKVHYNINVITSYSMPKFSLKWALYDGILSPYSFFMDCYMQFGKTLNVQSIATTPILIMKFIPCDYIM
jgi:hypothetical protein